MNINIVPPEILLKIFENLDGTTLLKCRKVSRRWNVLVNQYFSDAVFWRAQCALKYRQLYAEAHRRANISWRELHNSLDMWENIHQTNVQVSILQTPQTEQYHFVGHDLISCSHNTNSHPDPDNRIVYYDINKRKQVKQFVILKKINGYFENNELLIYDIYDNRSHMMMICPKGYDSYRVENLKYGTRCHVSNSCVYYNTDYALGRYIATGFWRIRCKFDEEPTYIHELLHVGPTCDILDVVYDSRAGVTYVLRSDANNDYKTLTIAAVSQEEPPYADIYWKVFLRNDVFNTLKAYGFHWTNPKTLDWLQHDEEYKYDPRIVIPDVGAALTYNNYIIVATKTPPIKLNFYRNPYNMFQRLIIHKIQPVMSINLNEYVTPELKDRPDAYAKEIGVTEIFGGHRITLIYSSQVLILHLTDANEIKFATVLSPANSDSLLSSASDDSANVNTMNTDRNKRKHHESAEASTSKQTDSGSNSDRVKTGAIPKQKIQDRKPRKKRVKNTKSGSKGNSDDTDSNKNTTEDNNSDTKDQVLDDFAALAICGDTSDNDDNSPELKVGEYTRL